MELVYLWVEDYKNIKKQGFNFSPRFKCEYDDNTKNLEIIDKEETGEFYPKNFFGKNINITAIVGENGSGKSSVCKSIFDFKRNEELKNKKIAYLSSFACKDNLLKQTINVDIFLVYFDRFSKKYFYYLNNDIGFLKINGKEVPNSRKIDNFLTSYLNNAKNILLTTDIHNVHITLLEQTIQLLMKYSNFYAFYNKEYIFTKIIIKIHRDKLLKKEFADYKYKDFLQSLREKILNILEEKMKPRQYSGEFLKEIKRENYLETSSSNDFIFDLKLAFLTSFFNNLVHLFGNNENVKKDFLEKNKDYFDDLTIDNMIEKFTKFNKIINHHTLHYNQNKNIIESFILLLNFLKNHKMDKFLKLISKKNLVDDEYFILEFDVQKDKEILKETLTNVLALTYTNENDLMNMFQLDFKNFDGTIGYNELSDGEKAIFEVFTQVLYRIIFMNEKTLFLDEPETFFHPNWSKELINLLIKLVDKLELKDLNIVITTHSPFLLSDLPKENVIFLEKDEKTGNCINATNKVDINPFGANIHTLLSHGFFMKDGLMGEFAKEKINEVIKYLNNDNDTTISSDKEAQSIVNIIGEPIIKRELQRMLKNKMELSNKEEIDTIKEEIKVLTKKLNKLEGKE